MKGFKTWTSKNRFKTLTGWKQYVAWSVEKPDGTLEYGESTSEKNAARDAKKAVS